MAFTEGLFEDLESRKRIKSVFGNRRNWQRYCHILEGKRFAVWARTV